ncbi:MAG: LacI family transcriptional regulator [Actinobacteria bacterium]|nr:LacI family transcriptional regulator [Actinomycetota bacterium]
MSRERASVKDVAERAGVSVGTVSNVLNRPDMVSERTRVKVEAAMAELRFLRNASARQLRAGVSTTVGAVLADLGNPFYTEIARGIEDRLAVDGQTLMLCSSDENPQREAAFLRQFAEQGVRGMLVTPMPATVERLLELRELGIDSVLIDATSESLPSVRVDHVSGGRQAVAHLLERGHRRILFLGDDPHLQQARHRLRGATEAVIAAGLSPTEVLSTHRLDSLDATAGEEAILTILAAPQRPTAVFCINDLVALGVLRTLRHRGVAVPEEMAIVGYDDLYWAGELATPLSSVRQPMRQIGWAAADLLLGNSAAGASRVFEPELVVRASS